MTKFFIKLISFIIYFTIILSCSSKSKNSGIKYSKLKRIEILDKLDKPLPWDSLIEKITIVPLETNKNCLIGSVDRISNVNDKFYILDRKNHTLFIFDEKGKFIFKINKKGKAGGEYIELRDFKVDSIGNIFILDFAKIIKYSSNGEYLSTMKFYKLKDDETNDFITPTEFALGKDGDIYVWNGSLKTKNSKKNKYGIYKVSSKGKILNRYLPLNRQVFKYSNFFYDYNSAYNLQPILGNDTIYSIIDGEFYASYYIDFGDRKLPDKKLPIINKGLSRFLKELEKSDDFCFGIHEIVESENVLVFNFHCKGENYFSFNSKKSNKQINGKGTFLKRIRPHFFNCTYKGSLVSLMETYTLKIMENLISSDDFKSMSGMDQLILNNTKKMNDLSNPALLFIKLKQF